MLRPQCVVERIRSRLSWCSCIRLFAAGAVVYATAALNLNADEKPQPRIALCSPLGLSRGSTTKVVLRGWALEEVSDVHASDASITIKLLSKGNAPLPNQQDAAKIGDRQLELEITVPSEISVSETRLTLVTNDPMPPSCVLLIGGRYPVVSEAEPNDGFREAQLLAFPQIVDGVIEADRKVDVFSFSLPMAQRVTMTLEARSFGSGLDSILAVYDERGRRLIENDDQVNSTDSRLERMLPAGRYFVVVQDALDRGGPAHPYRLTLASSE